MDELLRDFLSETGEAMHAVRSHVLRLRQRPDDAQAIAAMFRLFHTIKGTCGFVGLPRLERLAHAAENVLAALRDGAPADEAALGVLFDVLDRVAALLAETNRDGAEPEGDDNDLIARLVAPRASAIRVTATEPVEERRRDVRVPVADLDELLALACELQLVSMDTAQAADRARRSVDRERHAQIARIAADLRRAVMGARLEAVGEAWRHLPDLVRDIAASLDKKVELEIKGADIRLDRAVLDTLRDPLVHLIRNAVGHGIETAEGRQRAGKPAQGMIRIGVRHERGAAVVQVEDDGRGLDHELIGLIAVARGLILPADLKGMVLADLSDLIFAPGLSTAPEVTILSGRGVGLDAVRTDIEAAGGEVEVRSAAGKGAVFTLTVPLSLAEAPVLLVDIGGRIFALPDNAGGDTGAGGAVDARPLLSPGCGSGGGVSVSGLKVDAVLGARLAAIRPLPPGETADGLFIGAAILEDGSVAMLIDPLAVRHRASDRQPEQSPATLLLVGADALIRRLCCAALEDQGWRVLSVPDCVGALNVLRDPGCRIDAVAVDLCLPAGEAFALAATGRRITHRAGVRLIALHGFSSRRLRARCAEAGFDGQIPVFDRQALLAAVGPKRAGRRAA
jgi:two-component system, chemotaxis family, sensor kinase CheA